MVSLWMEPSMAMVLRSILQIVLSMRVYLTEGRKMDTFLYRKMKKIIKEHFNMVCIMDKVN